MLEIQPDENIQTKGNEFEQFVAKYGVPLSILIGLSLIAASIYLSFGLPNLKNSGNNNVAGALTPSPTGVGAPAPAGASPPPPTADDDPVLGDPGAPVTLIEFSDFQCPFCRKLWRETLPAVKKNYIDTGQAKLVYRDFPLTSIHPAAQSAAEAGECADDQSRFWDMHDKIFGEQDRQGQGTVQFTVSDLKKWAREIGLDMAEFNSCLDSQKYRAEVEQDLAAGQAAGVTGTPGTFVNGQLVNGSVPFAAFAQAIDAALER